MSLGKRIFTSLLLMGLVTSACVPGELPTTNSASPAASPTLLPSASPTHTPFVPDRATDQPAHKVTQPAPEKYGTYGTPDPASEAVANSQANLQANQAGFASKYATGDMFTISMVDVPRPPAGQLYQGWLLSDRGAYLSVGMLEVSPDGRIQHEWVSPNGENLLINYRSVQITLESELLVEAPKGKSFFYGGLDPATWQTAQNLFVKNDREPATPLNKALVPGLKAQLDVAIQHIHNAENAAKIGALAEMRNHMEHTINIIEGASGPRFKDYNGDGAAQNPGDGFGVKGYAREIASLVDRDAARSAAQGLMDNLNSIQDICEQVIAQPNLQSAVKTLEEISAFLPMVNADSTALMEQTFHFIQFDVIPDSGN